ncbi:E2F-associated phosphoprotein [Caligus rogercresseyi]|uniref:E2F-associated phosphoprotein n=1 Tax=Caligus rogercresseyi TaxID=217165 RepID=A0A7T8QV46_CALRO|nr:E2F-associated phosphoprotein [Caligus rogercresseyi]
MDDYLREDYRGDSEISDEDDLCPSSSEEEEDENLKALQACDARGKINIQKLMSTLEPNKNSDLDVLHAENSIKEEDDEMDDFEKDMKVEFESRAEVARSSFMPTSSECPSKQLDEKKTSQYDDIYFDSDDETETKNGDFRSKKSNEELLYDPGEDDRDQAWIDSIRRSYTRKGNTTISQANKEPPKPLPNSDAVLNCPACFAVVCLDCQRHELYQNQYRAMFVMNCSVDPSKKLAYSHSKRSIKKNKAGPSTAKEELYNPVKCDACETQLAVYDKEEIYHFFNVVSSHS